MLDPFVLFEGGVLHQADIRVAEAVTGVPGVSICGHVVDPLVRAGISEQVAVAGLHWGIVGAGLGVVGAAIALATRR